MAKALTFQGASAAVRSIEVATAARLHLGFLDLNGDLGRRFGSIGLSIDAFETRVEIVPGGQFQALGCERERSASLAQRACEGLGLKLSGKLTVASAIPAHSGLGSGTQLALAIGSALRRLHHIRADTNADALILDRGGRSGAGAALFERGGLVLDVGRGPRTDMPPVVTHLPFPEEWRIVLIMDPAVEGVHGEAERVAFARLPALPAELAGEICRRTLMQVLPGAAERDLDLFGEGVAAIQAILGDYFAPAQGGGRFTSTAVGLVAERLRARGARGVGQSSWGPTAFAFAGNQDEAAYLTACGGDANVVIITCAARNRGACIEEREMIGP
jgi:beta-RFAP synthase